jgi:hypothetical protein
MSVAVTRFLAGPLPTRLEGARQVATDYHKEEEPHDGHIHG